MKPPLLGVFEYGDRKIVFSPILGPPDCIPPQRFNLGRCSSRRDYDLLDCRHGLVLVKNRSWTEVVVCDPITSEQRCVDVLPKFKMRFFNGAVLCAAGDQGHVHGSCHSSPFKVVLMSIIEKIINPSPVFTPRGLAHGAMSSRRMLHISFFMLVFLRPLLMNVSDHDMATWAPWKTIDIHSILGLPPQIEGLEGGRQIIQGYDEDTDVIFINLEGSVYMVNLKSIQSRKLYETVSTDRCHPFKSFYTPGISIAVESNGAEILHNT